METGYIDLHTHTNLSDGKLSPEELIHRAIAAGIRVLAITDHNAVQPELPRLRRQFPQIELVTGCEFSCREPDIVTEIHIVGLDFDADHPAIVLALQRNRLDRRPRVEAILKRLREECGIDLGSYEQLLAENPGSKFVGRAHIAQKMFRLGFVESVDRAYEEYIGDFGMRRAFVEKNLAYIPMEDAVGAILAAGGIAILAHPLYYKLTEARLEQLVAKAAALGCMAMEVEYPCYDEAQQVYLSEMALRHGLLHSAGSDYHGIREGDTLEQRYPVRIYRSLMAGRK